MDLFGLRLLLHTFLLLSSSLLPSSSFPRRDFMLPAAAAADERSATVCRSFRALFTQINWTAANLLHKTLPNAVASAAFVKDTHTVTMHLEKRCRNVIINYQINT